MSQEFKHAIKTRKTNTLLKALTHSREVIGVGSDSSHLKWVFSIKPTFSLLGGKSMSICPLISHTIQAPVHSSLQIIEQDNPLRQIVCQSLRSDHLKSVTQKVTTIKNLKKSNPPPFFSELPLLRFLLPSLLGQVVSEEVSLPIVFILFLLVPGSPNPSVKVRVGAGVFSRVAHRDGSPIVLC